MANVLHSQLTGSDLHECKGAAAASSGQVPIATGSGTAVFGALSYAQLSGTPIAKPMLDETTPSEQVIMKTYSVTPVAGAWTATLTGFTTVWAVYASVYNATTPTVSTVSTVSATTVTGKNVATNSVTPGGTDVVHLTVIGV